MDFTNKKLALLESNDFADIYSGLAHNFYAVKEKVFSEKELAFATILEGLIQRKGSFSELNNTPDIPKNFVDSFRDEVVSAIEINGLVERLPSRKDFVSLLDPFTKLVVNVPFIKDKLLFCERVLHNSIGLKQLSFFSLDDDLEELMINSLDSIFVFHKRFGMCKISLSLSQRVFESIIWRIAFSVNKKFDAEHPLLDARLPDGSRVNATVSDVSPKGNSLTIRKFATIPLTVLDLIENGTISSEAASFLWLMVDGMNLFPQNIIVSGSTASGKTTLLNILSNFIRFSERIVTIEDTLELSLLDRSNWVALEAKHAMDCEVSMDALLKNALRMRPDRIVVGEVRGSEAITLFTAMDNGHSGLGTLHANDAREAVVKLQERPFEVPSVMVPLVDLIVVMQRHYSKQFGIQRRVVQIAEVSRMENKVLLANVYEFRPAEGKLLRTDVPSHVIEDLAEKTTVSKNDLKKEMETRRMILEWMLEKGIRKPHEVLEVIQSYYYNPDKVTSMVFESAK